MRIAIVGAGIGGLATALSLEAAGFRDVTVYERAPELRPLGVGINLLPHAMRELTELGLADAVAVLGVPPTSLVYANRLGQTIWSEPRGLAAGYRWPQLSIHRGELQMMLARTVRERLGDVIRLGHTMTELEPLRFTTDSGIVTAEADLVVAADGIHSRARALQYPAEGAPPSNGLILWRGVARCPAFLDGRTMIMAGDGEQKFVAYPIAGADTNGDVLLNFIAERRQPATEGADWNRAVDPAPVIDAFREWRYDWLDVPAVIAASEELLEYPMVDRDPIPQWTFGRTTLLGDAAHAMYPNGSNGASQAIIDARTLAFQLASSTDVATALARYERERRPATAALLESTRQSGPERVMILARERAPEGFRRIEDVIPRAELEQIATGYKRAAGFAPDILNERPTLTVGARG